jgi:hypothetical protein
MTTAIIARNKNVSMTDCELERYCLCPSSTLGNRKLMGDCVTNYRSDKKNETNCVS